MSKTSRTFVCGVAVGMILHYAYQNSSFSLPGNSQS